MKHTVNDLYIMQGMDLESKIKMTKRRIEEWLDYWGGQVAVSFSGGKDSTVLLHIAREIDPNIPAVFFDTGMEEPGIREFVKTIDNVEMVKPQKSFYQILNEYGYPIVSKEVAQAIREVRRFIDVNREDLERKNGGVGTYGELNKIAAWQIVKSSQFESIDLMKEIEKSRGSKTVLSEQYNKNRWKYLLDAPFLISEKCCLYMKKNPSHSYEKEHDIKFLVATMANESFLRRSQWLIHGCNSFDSKNPKSAPMSFWTEQDVLRYIYKYKIPIAKNYGIVTKDGDIGGFEQIELFDIDNYIFDTTIAKRTGCYTCGFGAHHDKHPTRLERIEPKYRDIVLQGGKFIDGLWKPYKGFGFYFVYAWLNAHGNGRSKVFIPDEEKYYNALPDEAKAYLQK